MEIHFISLFVGGYGPCNFNSKKNPEIIGTLFLLRREGSNLRPPAGGYEPYDDDPRFLIKSQVKLLPDADFNCFSLRSAFDFKSKVSE